MSNVLKLETPLGVLFRKPKLKGITSIVSSCQILNNDQTEFKPNERLNNDRLSNDIQIIANRFITIKRLGSGGFGVVC